jgi:mono/diheme cytochrome c family protein
MKTRHYLLILIPILLSACSFSLAEDITPPPGSQQQAVLQTETSPQTISGPLFPLVAPNPANGEPIYAEKCAPCHGTSGQGDGPQASQLPNPVTPLGDPQVARQATPSQWYTQVTQGNLERFMPPFNSLTDRQRWDVVAYAFSLSVDPAQLETGAELYQSYCASCHGQSGQGDGPKAAGLANDPPDFTDQERMAEKTSADFYQAMTEGLPPSMPAFDEQLSDNERWALSEYLHTFTYASSGDEIAAQGSPIPEGTAVEEAQPNGESGETPTTPAETQTAETSQMVGTVSGEVINASSEELPPDLEVTLHGFDDMQAVYTQTVTLNTDGTFLFDNVDMPSGRAYIVTTDFNGTTYGSDIGVVQPDIQTMDLPMTIFGTTTDASILSVDRLHLFFEFIDEKNLRVIELYVISNPTDKTLVAPGDGQGTVEFTLPENASNLEFQNGALGDRYIQTDNGFADTVSVRPGSGNYEVLFAYQIPYDRRLELTRPAPLGIDAVVIMVPENGINVSGDTLQDGGVREVDNAQYHIYNGGTISRGQSLELTLTGRPSTGGPGLLAGSSSSLLIGLGAFGTALIVAGVWLYRRTQARVVDDEAEFITGYPSPDDSDDPDTLMDAIIALDDLYREGELPEEAYQQRRAALKTRLKEAMNE